MYRVPIPISNKTPDSVIIDKLNKYVENVGNSLSPLPIISKLPQKRNSTINIPVELYQRLKGIYPNQPIENIVYTIFRQKEDERYYGGLLFLSNEGWEREKCIPDIGFIDGFNYHLNKIVELKFASNWKSALGQILAYGLAYPRMKKEIWLLLDKQMKISQKRKIESVCKHYAVEVSWISI